MSQELVIPETPSTVPATDSGGCLLGWLLAYCHAEVAGAPKTTLQAKRRDLELFLSYFGRRDLLGSGTYQGQFIYFHDKNKTDPINPSGMSFAPLIPQDHTRPQRR